MNTWFWSGNEAVRGRPWAVLRQDYRGDVFAADVVTRGNWQVVHVTGDLDLATVPAFRRVIVGAVGPSTPRVIVDLTACDVLDSVGLGLLLGGLKRTRSHGGNLVVVCDEPRILRVLELSDLVRIVPVFASVADALDGAPEAALNVDAAQVE